MNKRIGEILKACGLKNYGFCRFEDAGELLPTRNIKQIPQNAASIIAVLFPYKIPYEGERNLSLYCIGKDYHTIVTDKLNAACRQLKNEFPKQTFAAFCDNSPIREVKAAYESGLGFLGKNSMIIHPKYGSFCFIGEIVTDLPLPSYSHPLGFCKNCGACLKACGSGALKTGKDGEDYLLDRELCLSWVMQQKGELSEAQKNQMRKNALVWGCDTCNLVCPMNKDAEFSDIEEFYTSPLPYLTEQNVRECSERAYGYKGEKILLRNLGIIYGDSDNNNGK